MYFIRDNTLYVTHVLHMVTHVLYMATGALGCNAFFNLQSVGEPFLRSTKALSVATWMRTAVKTLPSWKGDYDNGPTVAPRNDSLKGSQKE